MTKERTHYKIHVRCENCGWNTSEIQSAMGLRNDRKFSIEILLGMKAEQVLDTYRCTFCGCEGTCKPLYWGGF